MKCLPQIVSTCATLSLSNIEGGKGFLQVLAGYEIFFMVFHANRSFFVSKRAKRSHCSFLKSDESDSL